jgi:hypothetical protein
VPFVVSSTFRNLCTSAEIPVTLVANSGNKNETATSLVAATGPDASAVIEVIPVLVTEFGTSTSAVVADVTSKRQEMSFIKILRA